MKALLLPLIVALSLNLSFGQGWLTISPVPVTNSLTGNLADASISAGLYCGATGTAESGLQLLSAAPLSNGFATFGSVTAIPGFPSGTTITLQVRAWSGVYPSYEAALASGLPATLAGKSVALSAVVWGTTSPPPIPDPMLFPGFTIWPVPEPNALTLCLLSATLLRWRAKAPATPSC